MESGKDRRNATRAVFSPVLSWYLGFTSTGGLSQFRDSDNAVSRACWLVLFAAGACLTAYNAVQNIREYLAFEVVTTITVKTNATLEFPAVTICPLNRVHCGNLHNRIRECDGDPGCGEDEAETLCMIYGMSRCFFSNKFAALYSHNQTLTDADRACPKDERLENLPLKNPQSLMDQLLTILYSLRMETRIAIANRPDKLIRGCRFQLDPNCTGEFRMHTIVTASTGVCYSFNYAGDGGGSEWRRRSFLSGEPSGLIVAIDTEMFHGMMQGLAQSEGVKVLIHEPDKFPMTASSGLKITPGHDVSVALRLSEMHRETEPYPSNCTSEWPEDYEQGYRMGTDVAYSESLCTNICMDRMVLRECGCVYLSASETADRNAGDKACNVTDPENAGCLVRLLSLTPETFGDLCVECRPQCAEKFYETTVSQSGWPSRVDWPRTAALYGVRLLNDTVDPDLIMNIIEESAEYGDTVGETTDRLAELSVVESLIRNRFIRLTVFYEDNAVRRTVEKRKFTRQMLLSTVGGTFSLFLGISLVALFDVMELVIRIAVKAVQRGMEATRKNNG